MAALRGQYRNSSNNTQARQSRKDKAHSYRDLTSSEISRLCRILTNYPDTDSPVRGSRRATYATLVKQTIVGLPNRLLSNPGLVTRTFICNLGPRFRDHVRELCPTHLSLRPELVNSIFDFIKKEVEIRVETTLQQLASIPGFMHQVANLDRLCAFASLAEISAMWVDEQTYHHRYRGCELKSKWERQPDGCAACMLARLGANEEFLIGLRTSMLVWMSSHRAVSSNRMLWVEQWMMGFGEEKFAEMMVESANLARWIRGELKKTHGGGHVKHSGRRTGEIRDAMPTVMRHTHKMDADYARQKQQRATSDHRSHRSNDGVKGMPALSRAASAEPLLHIGDADSTVEVPHFPDLNQASTDYDADDDDDWNEEVHGQEARYFVNTEFCDESSHTMFLDHDSLTGEFRFRHRIVDVTASDNAADTYVSPRVDWMSHVEPSIPRTAEHDWNDEAGSSSKTSEPASSTVISTTRRSSSLYSMNRHASSRSSYSVTAADIIDPFADIGKGTGRPGAPYMNHQNAVSMAQSYQAVVPDWPLSPTSVPPETAEGPQQKSIDVFLGDLYDQYRTLDGGVLRDERASRSEDSDKKSDVTQWPSAWL